MSVAVDVMRQHLATPERRANWMPALILAVTTALVGFWVLASGDGPLELAVRGAVYTDAAALREATTTHLDQGLFAVSPAAVETAIEALPWVAKAHVARRFPNRLVARITEHQAVARWGDAALISQAGVIFAPAAATWPADLPRLDGPAERRSELVAAWSDLSSALGETPPRLVAIAIDERGSWTAELDDGVVLRLGRSGIADRMDRFAGAARAALAERWSAVAAIDLRYTNGFAVSWRQPEQQPERGM